MESENVLFPRPTPEEYRVGFDEIADLGLGERHYEARIKRASKREAAKLWRAVVRAFPFGADAVPTPTPTDGLEIVASDSLSGGPYPCIEPTCRAANASIGARFAALYADHLVIRDPIGGHDGEHPKEALQRILPVMFTWRPLFEAGLASHVARICSHCAETQLRTFRGDSRSMKRLQADLEKRLIAESQFVVERIVDDDLYVRVEAPLHFLQHGSTTQEVKEKRIAARLQTLLAGSDQKSIPRRTAKSLGLVREVANPIVHEFLMQQLHRSVSLNAHYASNIGIDLELANNSTPSELRWPQGLLDALAHSVPIVASAPIADLVRFRQENPTAFRVYRHRVQSLAKHSSDIAATKELAAQLQQEFDTLEHTMRASRAGLMKKSKNELLLVGTIGVALSSVLPPAALVAILGALAGPTLRDLVKPRVSEEVMKHPLYFLWQLSKQPRAPVGH